MSQNLKIILAFAVIYVVWGTTYLAIIFAIKDIPPLLMSGLRFMLAGILLYLFCFFSGQNQQDFKSFSRNSLAGLLMLAGGTVSVTWAEQFLSSSTTAIIVTSVPVWFVLLDKRQWRNYFSNKILISGIIIGFAGVILLISSGKQTANAEINLNHIYLGIFIVIAGGIAWTSGSLFSKYHPPKGSVYMNTAVQLLVAGFVCFCASIFTGESSGFNFAQVHIHSLLAFFYLVFFGSILTYICYLWLLRVKTAAQVSSYVYVNPLVAVILGSLIAHEKLNGLQIFALFIIICGVFFINLPKYKLIRKGFSQEIKIKQNDCKNMAWQNKG